MLRREDPYAALLHDEARENRGEREEREEREEDGEERDSSAHLLACSIEREREKRLKKKKEKILLTILQLKERGEREELIVACNLIKLFCFYTEF